MNRIVVIPSDQQISVDTQEVTNIIVLQEQQRTIILQSEGVQGPQGPVGPQGPSGTSDIGGYPVVLDGSPNNFDALMFVTGEWTNIPQTEISDGGNF
jgi:hypothetical protein